MMDAGNFTEDEKRFVLAEYIKASQVDTDQLVAFIKTYNLQADWFSMQLPGGRNMHQCMRAASTMLDIELDLPRQPSMPNLKKRKSASDLLTDQAPKRVASMATPILYQPPAQTPPPHQPSPQLPPLGSAPRAVSIQPRPTPDVNQTTADGYGVFQSKTPSNGYGVFQSNPTGRKRGRPSKAEKEAQARASSTAHVASGPVPISPKPAGLPGQGPLPSHGPPAPPPGGPGPGHGPSYSTHAAAASADSRVIPRSGSAAAGGGFSLPRGSPRHYAPEPPTSASLVKSEKSPSIGNLVGPADPPEEKTRGAPSPLVPPFTRDPPPVTNSA